MQVSQSQYRSSGAKKIPLSGDACSVEFNQFTEFQSSGLSG
jgi:hypothetical protein